MPGDKQCWLWTMGEDMASYIAYCLCVSSGCDQGGGGGGGICHVGFWSFKKPVLISFGLTWVMFIVPVAMSSQLPHSTQQVTDEGNTLHYATLYFDYGY